MIYGPVEGCCSDLEWFVAFMGVVLVVLSECCGWCPCSWSCLFSWGVILVFRPRRCCFYPINGLLLFWVWPIGLAVCFVVVSAIPACFNKGILIIKKKKKGKKKEPNLREGSMWLDLNLRISTVSKIS